MKTWDLGVTLHVLFSMAYIIQYRTVVVFNFDHHSTRYCIAAAVSTPVVEFGDAGPRETPIRFSADSRNARDDDTQSPLDTLSRQCRRFWLRQICKYCCRNLVECVPGTHESGNTTTMITSHVSVAGPAGNEDNLHGYESVTDDGYRYYVLPSSAKEEHADVHAMTGSMIQVKRLLKLSHGHYIMHLAFALTEFMHSI